MIPGHIKMAAENHARLEFPKESCGLMVQVGGIVQYVSCRNLAEKQSDFILDPADYMRAEELGTVLALFHSHPNAPATPSQSDRVACELSGLPWYIVSIPSGTWETFLPSGYKAPLIGREFSHGRLDCFTLIRDWFKQERGIELPDFPRSEEWWAKGKDLYRDNFGKAGFVMADGPLAPGDVIVMQIRSPVPNHAGIYMGDDIILHHMMRRLSCREVYGTWWRSCTQMILRYAVAT